jgi:hypothetical protein
MNAKEKGRESNLIQNDGCEGTNYSPQLLSRLKQRTYEQIGGFDIAMYEKVLVKKREACAKLFRAGFSIRIKPKHKFLQQPPTSTAAGPASNKYLQAAFWPKL